MFDKTIFGKNLYNLRKSKGLKQEELGKIIGLSKQAISDIERGNRSTSIENLYKFSIFFNVSADYLIGLKNFK